MGEALNLFAQQAGVQIFFPGEMIAGRRTPALRGVMEPRAALDRLIADAGLTVVKDDGRVIVLRVVATPDRAGGAARDPDPPRSRAARPNSDAATPLEEVIVTSGPRAGDLKRDSDTVVNTITQLEIQRLPNLDISDVLARLPGMRRNETQSGENRYVQIRGLNNSAASQSIDGVLLTNYANPSRATPTELLPAYFVKDITVTSTVTPDLDENANSAHVAITTISGLDNQGRRLADLRAFVGDNNRSGGARSTERPLRLVGAWRGALDDAGRIGLALGASLDHLGSRQDATSLSGYNAVNGVLVPFGALTRGETYTRTRRLSATARLDIRPDERLSMFAEYFFLNHDFTTEQRLAAVTVATADASNATDGAGRFGAGAANFGFYRTEAEATGQLVQLGGDYRIGPSDTLSARLGVTFNRAITGRDGGAFAQAASVFTTPIGYVYSHNLLDFTSGGGGASSDPANYRLTGKFALGDTLLRDQNYFARVDYAHNIATADQGLGVKLGAQLKTLDRSNLQRGYARLAPAEGIALSDVTDAPSLTLFRPIDWKRDAFLDLLNRRGSPAPDANGLYALDPADGYGQNFNGSERVGVGYGIVSYGGARGRLSAGVRAAHTHRELDQYEPDAVGRYVQAHYAQGYWHVLPSAYGALDVTSRLKLRAAFTKTLERPSVNAASRRLVINYDTPITRVITYSDPYLMPIRSSNFDAAAEYYYGRGAYFSLGSFSKDLRDIPAVSSTQSIAADGVREVTTYTKNVREVNGKKVYGRINGLEVVWADPSLPYLPDRWGNLGLTLSYTYTDYRITAINGGNGQAATNTRLVDAAPRDLFNAFLAYNKGPFAANLSAQEMSPPPGAAYDPANDRRAKYEWLVDLQASWRISDAARVLVEGRNLFDQDITDRYGATNYGPAYQVRHNGRTVWLGLQMTLF
ncbi:TonB-dependent receptor [Caulobacter soli]|uniref:TonB-dependent receptor n=1 Tax=Caulobacter soli TaxID=2708539 RepID=UPI0031B58FC8